MKLTSTLFCLALAGLSFSFSSAQAQTSWCATDEETELLKVQYPELARQREINEILWNQNTPDASANKQTVRVIPVVVHVITETGLGGISKQQIETAIDRMTKDFRRQNFDTASTRPVFKPFAADCQIEFRLAKIDPNGNCTEGIVRAASPLTNSANPRNLVKAVSYWPSDKYFNIWIVNSIYSANAAPGTYVAGYAQFPGTGPANTFGFVCRADQFGTGTGSGLRTATHELGHCVNLYHTFQGGCGNSCNTSGDFVCDTPPVPGPTYGCSTTQNTCSNDTNGPGSVFTTNVVDQVENYMSYDVCQNMFTLGQKARMDAALANDPLLSSLISPANAIATGINQPTVLCAPVADFRASGIIACQNADVFFFDQSYNAPEDASWTWNWSFPGATPSTSTLKNPVVVYSSPGSYTVTLQVTNSAGTHTVTKTDYIEVKPVTGLTAPFTEDVTEATFPSHPSDPLKDWEIQANSTNTWHRYVTNYGEPTLRIRNSFIGSGVSNYVISPSIDISGITSPTLTFDVAYARASSTANDALRVYFSTDCGRTWALRFNKNGSALSTVGSDLIPNFEPANNTGSFWRTETIAIGNPHAGSNNLRIRFEALSASGNSIYLDNINITGVLGADEAISAGSVALYPNPATDMVTLQLSLRNTATISGSVLDVVGREVAAIAPRTAEAGTLSIPVSLAGLPSGVYFVRVIDGASVVTRKLIKE